MSETTFTVEDNDYYIVPVDAKILSEAQRVYNKTFRKAIDDGCILKKKLNNYMLDQKLWDDNRENEYKRLIKTIAEHEFKLNKGGLKLSEAKQIALNLKKDRGALRDLISERTSLDSQTVEGQSDNERFNYLVSACVYSSLTRKPVFSSLEDYKEKSDSNLSYQLASKFAEYIYGVASDYDDTLTETKFLKRFKFIDEKGYLINKEGKRVDEDGNLLDDDGFRVDAEGKRIDINNNPILDTTVDEVDFIDDLS